MAGRKRKTPKTQQARVLELIWERHGSNRLALRLGFTASLLNSWKRILGHVPLVHLGKVSRYLKIDPLLLNYEQLSELRGNWKNWIDVVYESKLFNESELEYILRGKLPCVNSD